jgi:subtilisin family serine protease
MDVKRPALLALAVVLGTTFAQTAAAQKLKSVGASRPAAAAPPPAPPTRGGGGGGGNNGGYRGGGDGGYRGSGSFGGWGGVVGGVLTAIPPGRFVDDGTVDDDGPPPSSRRSQQNAARRNSNAPPAAERRLVPDEVVIELRNSATPAQIDALQRRFRLARIGSTPIALTGTTFYRWRIPDRRSVGAVVRQLEADRLVASAQPNYQFALQETAAAAEGDPAQYELAKLHLPQAHALAKGGKVRVAVIDSAVDTTHPDLAGVIAETFNATGTPVVAHAHGTAIAALIAAHGKLVGAAPEASILAVRAFDPKGGSAQGTTFAIIKGLDWAVAQHARVINMSFAGPADPAIHRALEAAHRKGIVLIAAAGNAGPKSPPLYPAADADVIAVTGTDAQDRVLAVANRGRYIAVAAPGADLLVAIPGGGYEVSSGTSYAAAEIAGIAALLIDRNGDLKPTEVRGLLIGTAHDLGPKGRDAEFGAGLVDAFAAVSATDTPVARASTGAR